MTEVQEIILNQYFPEYGDYKSILESYSDYELNLIVDNLPESIDDIPESINKEVQWDVLNALCSTFVDNWDEFYNQEEGMIMDFCWNNDSIISYNDSNRSYEISKDGVIELCKDLISESEKEYTINEEADLSETIMWLNKNFSIKFCEV